MTKKAQYKSGRGHFSESQVARSLQDSNLGGRGDIANKEKGIGKGKGKSYSRGQRKSSVVSKDLKRVERNLGVRH